MFLIQYTITLIKQYNILEHTRTFYRKIEKIQSNDLQISPEEAYKISVHSHMYDNINVGNINLSKKNLILNSFLLIYKREDIEQQGRDKTQHMSVCQFASE